MTRVGRYDNPYRAATWDREPPDGTRCTPLLLDTADGALAHGWLYDRGGEDTAVMLMHPRADFSHHYVVPGLVEAGYAVMGVNSRWLNNDATLLHELVLLDVAAGVAALRERYDRVVFVGNSGGGSLLTLYLKEALAPEGGRLTDTAAGDPFDLNRFDLPAADAMAYLAAHVGEGHYLLHAIDASVVDEGDPLSCDPALDLYDPANGFVEPPAETHYDPAFLERYRAGQRTRVERIDAVARERVARRQGARGRWATGGGTPADRRASIATEFLTVYRTDADPRYVDLSLDRSKRDYGSLWGVRPDWINYGAVGFGRVVSPEAWLSTWSGLSSRASIEHTGADMTLPALVVSYSGDHGIFPSDTDLIASSLGTTAVGRVEVDADHCGFPADAGRDRAVATIAEWIGALP
ncbi:MAG: alpha/beta hydrolase family protein [Actinomycetota bacterium]